MTKNETVTLSVTTDAEARALIQRNHIGRLAFTLHDRVDIEPITYACDDGWIYMRTSEGHKVDVLRHHPWVAFQVDEIHSRNNWESVVVHGRIQGLPEDGTTVERAAREQAIAVLRSIDPAATGPSDAFPHRNQVLRLHLDEVSGRRAVSRPHHGSR